MEVGYEMKGKGEGWKGHGKEYPESVFPLLADFIPLLADVMFSCSLFHFVPTRTENGEACPESVFLWFVDFISSPAEFIALLALSSISFPDGRKM